ncbi:MAG: rod shape-determining protein MreC [Saprospiraceae bacterium]|nr:rod shape-determining protein MreC [Saprospiraceae bacterium]
MHNLSQFFARFGTTILFIFLEIISFFLIVQYNSGQKEVFINSSSFYSGLVLENYSKLSRFYRLSSIADSIAKDNARLRAELRFATIDASFRRDSMIDTTYRQRYSFISAQVVSNSVNQIDNYITINKGSAFGIKPGMGVINDVGIVGVVRQTSANYATVASMLSSQTHISASIKRNGFFGSLVWDSRSSEYMHLTDIPKHANILKGDSVITSGYSSTFPKGLFVGRVESVGFESGSSFYDLKVKLSTDFNNLGYVYVVIDKTKPQLDSLNNAIIR